MDQITTNKILKEIDNIQKEDYDKSIYELLSKFELGKYKDKIDSVFDFLKRNYFEDTENLNVGSKIKDVKLNAKAKNHLT